MRKYKEEGVVDFLSTNGKIYISGKITGLPDLGAAKFLAAENLLIKMGATPVNPLKLPDDHDKTWFSYMKTCIRAMMDCGSIVVLDNWQKSHGAVREVIIASWLGMPVLSIETMQPLKIGFLTKIKLLLNSF